ncbi:DUF2303 family protein [Ralstonia syzygii subsp. celebesensis]|uniref:DUF2303 domain-containing protein n=2 Tax=Ralstonia syzygii subsp. celebesensis TaxID=1310168 RepID=A0A1U9VEF6_9RALS|nr:DUF2303 family protein [Ralstonia syzygii]AQW29058.1 hypothetical protein B0B51_02830 [blood disease bacterium A2-HR MARDI]QQV54398.1 DUF2303 family protein [Ralstonia syzygii subsp. celebesensis]CCA79327.1 conserved hypothetical protein [blood disease bacterium R229]
MEQQIENLAETLAKEMKQPVELLTTAPGTTRHLALPPGWKLEARDHEKDLPTPVRKRATVRLKDADSFIDYVKRHGSLTSSTIWGTANYQEGKVAFTAIINDHGEDDSKPQWRDHTARFAPEFSEEWRRWFGKNRTPMSQVEFAAFIEENLADVACPDNAGLPTGAQMLEMALSFEANQDMRFKSAVRLSNGGVQMSFVQDDDAQTLAKMQLFERFALGIPVFWNGDAYRIDARLRYRVRDGKLTFWYELIRQDKALEDATVTLIKKIREQTGTLFFFGDPFAS